MGVKILSSGDVITAVLDGDIDHHSAKKIREAIDEQISNEKPSLVQLDFSGVQFMDSSGIGLIMGRYKIMNILGGKIRVINVPKSLERMIKLSGLVALGIFDKEVKSR